SSMTSASSSRCTPRRSTTTRRSRSSRPATSSRAGRASARGWRTAWEANPPGVDAGTRRQMLDDLAKLNQRKLDDYGDPEIATRIGQYEMAFRMQTSVPDLLDFSNEPKSVIDMYGPDVMR